MTPEDLEKLLKLIALINQGAKAITDILANRATQAGMSNKDLFIRAEKHNEEALDIITNL